MSSPVKMRLRLVATWPPLNRAATRALHVVLPSRLHRHPVLARWVPRVGLVEAPLPGGGVLRLESRGDDDIAGPVFWGGWRGHEPETAGLFYELAGSARVTLDIGAHVGYFALLAAHANAAGQVYAFEPMARVRARLERNVALNAVANVMCVPHALGSAAATAEFFHVAAGVPSSSSLSEAFMRSIVDAEQLTSSVVEVVTADDFVDEHGLSGIDLVKLDTETTEPDVIRGMQRTLRRDRPQIVCEVLDAPAGHAIEEQLVPLGYEFFLLTDTGPVQREHIRPHDRWRNQVFRARADGRGR